MPGRKVALAAFVTAAVTWPLVTPTLAHFYGSLAVIYALIGLSLVVLVGWTGQISLGHAAFLGFGCYVGARLLNEGVPLVLALPLVALVGAVIGLALGIPSLRLRGVNLTIVTLAFGAACQRYLFVRPELRGPKADAVPRASLLGLPTTSDRGLYYAVLIVLGLALLLAYNIRSTDVGRVLFAIRDSEEAAQAMAVRVAPYKIGVFSASAALASVAGLFYGMLFQATPGPDQFGIFQSLFYLTMPVLGGAEALLGALVGGTFLAVGQPLVNLFEVRLYLVSSVALLVMLLSGKDGVVGLLTSWGRTFRESLRPDGPVRYGSFVPAAGAVADARPAVLRVMVPDRVRPGSVVRARITSRSTS